MKNFRQLINAIIIGILVLGIAGCEAELKQPAAGNQKPDNGQKPGNGQNPGSSGDAGASTNPSAPEENEFVILFTNDFHSQIEPLSKDETYNADRGGIKRIKALVDSVRAAEPAVLLADAGDFVQGTYYFSLLNGVVESMIMDELDYDVRTIGNCSSCRIDRF